MLTKPNHKALLGTESKKRELFLYEAPVAWISFHLQGLNLNGQDNLGKPTE